VHFLDSWRGLGLAELARLVWTAGLLGLAALMPGRRAARFAALGIGLAVPFLPELEAGWLVRAGWLVLWLAVAWEVGRPDLGESARPAVRGGSLESGAVSVLLGLALLLLLGAALARQDLPVEAGRRAAFALLVMCLGLVHLMLRHHVRRAALAFAALALGLQMLDGAARAAELAGTGRSNGAALLAGAVAVSLAARLGRARERSTGIALVSGAHDLHD
jgi:hypothetical protein